MIVALIVAGVYAAVAALIGLGMCGVSADADRVAARVLPRRVDASSPSGIGPSLATAAVPPQTD